MKKLALLLLVSLVAAQASFGLYVTTNTANTAWPGTTTIVQGGSNLSGMVQMSGCNWVILTKGSGGTKGQCTAEAVWFISSSASTSLETDALTSTPLQVKTPYAKFRLYNSGVGTATPEAIVYGY